MRGRYVLEQHFHHRRPKLMITLRVCYVTHKRVGVALQATVETLYEK